MKCTNKDDVNEMKIAFLCDDILVYFTKQGLTFNPGGNGSFTLTIKVINNTLIGRTSFKVYFKIQIH